MKSWSFYAPLTGLLHKRQIQCEADQVAANTPAGHKPIPGAYDHLSQRVDITVQAPDPLPVDEFLRPIPWYPPVIDYQPPAPVADTWRTWSWDTVTKRWLAVPTLAAYQRDKLIELKADALNASEQDITVQSITFAADAATRAELAQELALAQAEGAGYSCDWERADGTVITLTGAQVKGLLRAISARLASIRAQFRARKASVNAATTAAEVAAVTW